MIRRLRLSVRTRRRLAVFVGGSAGTWLRATVAAVLAGSLWATFLVNVLGALTLGFVVPRLRLSGHVRTLTLPLIAIGFLGAFTTFATFAVEVIRGPALRSVAYAVGTVAAGIVAAMVGLRLGRRR